MEERLRAIGEETPPLFLPMCGSDNQAESGSIHCGLNSRTSHVQVRSHDWNDPKLHTAVSTVE
jgi:hypothetical protein